LKGLFIISDLFVIYWPTILILMTAITDEFMKQMMTTTKAYTAVILKKGPGFKTPDDYPIIWEHWRNNFRLREEGLLSIVCPIREDAVMAGIGIFNADAEKTKELMEEDPAIKAGILTYEIYPTRSFPGDSLPALSKFTK
jgi:hypothetical protein